MSLFGKLSPLLSETLVETATPRPYVTRLIPLLPTNLVGAKVTGTLDEQPGSPSTLASR